MFSDYFGAEVQASYNSIRISSAFISGKSPRYKNLNFLGGLRVFTMSPERKTRLYFNLLGGLWQQRAERDSGTFISRQFGISTGAYLRHQGGLFYGLAYEGEGYIMLKLGYSIGVINKERAAPVDQIGI